MMGRWPSACSSPTTTPSCAGGWLRYLVPAAWGGVLETIDVRSVCLIREALAARSGVADCAFAIQGLGSVPVTLFGADALKHLAQAIRSRLPSGVVALIGVDGTNASVLVTVSGDLTGAGLHAGNLVKLAAPSIGGKGGGQAMQAQGGGKDSTGAQRALEAIREAVLA